MSNKVLAIVSSILVFGAIVAAFITVGSPSQQRARNFDNRKVNDLMSIQSQVVYYWQQKGNLPANLSELNNSVVGFNVPKDPQTNSDYEYKPNSNLSFELCANFNQPSVDSPSAPKPVPLTYPMGREPYYENWSHSSGRTCYTRTIDPDLTKPIPK